MPEPRLTDVYCPACRAQLTAEETLFLKCGACGHKLRKLPSRFSCSLLPTWEFVLGFFFGAAVIGFLGALLLTLPFAVRGY
jgi:hypothetical protein